MDNTLQSPAETLPLKTEHLLLYPLSLNQLVLYLNNPVQLGHELGFPVLAEAMIAEAGKAIREKITRMARVPEKIHLWHTYWLLVVEKNGQKIGVGLGGFKGEPDWEGEAEIGYGIDPAYRRQGYTTEAVRALIGWAFQSLGCRAVIAETDQSNIGSIRVLQHCGLTVYDEVENSFLWRIKKPNRPNHAHPKEAQKPPALRIL